MVPEEGSVADVGCGHGRLALALVERGHSVIATELSQRALDLLRRDLARVPGIEGARLQTRGGDGFGSLEPGEVDVAVVAGMGGRSVVRILDQSRWLPRCLVLQPVQDPGMVEAWVGARGWPTDSGRVVDRGREYQVWRVLVPPPVTA